jgi:hypothetical protein
VDKIEITTMLLGRTLWQHFLRRGNGQKAIMSAKALLCSGNGERMKYEHTFHEKAKETPHNWVFGIGGRFSPNLLSLGYAVFP